MSELWLLGTSRRIVDDIISENVGIFNDKFMSCFFFKGGPNYLSIKGDTQRHEISFDDIFGQCGLEVRDVFILQCKFSRPLMELE